MPLAATKPVRCRPCSICCFSSLVSLSIETCGLLSADSYISHLPLLSKINPPSAVVCVPLLSVKDALPLSHWIIFFISLSRRHHTTFVPFEPPIDFDAFAVLCLVLTVRQSVGRVSRGIHRPQHLSTRDFLAWQRSRFALPTAGFALLGENAHETLLTTSPHKC